MSTPTTAAARVPGLVAVWWTLGAVLVGVTLRVWHLLLFKLTVHRPAELAAWLMVAWVTIGLGYAVERRAMRRDDGAVPRAWSRGTQPLWLSLGLLTLLLFLFDVGFMRAAGDGRGYFAQLHSLVFDLDLDFSNDIEAFAARPGDALFPIGTAVLWLPFYVAAHLWTGLMGVLGTEQVRDGFANPYQRAVGLGSLAYGVAAIGLLAAALRSRFDGATTLAATIAILLATPVVWYVTVGASMSHAASLFTATIFLVAWMSTRGERSTRGWAALAAAAAAMVLVRPQNALFLLAIPVEAAGAAHDAWWSGERSRARSLLRSGAIAVLVMAAIAAAVVVGGGADLSYFRQQRLVSEWNVGLQLLSAHHGLLSSSPVLVFAVLGWLPLARRDRWLAAAFCTIVVAQVLVSGTSPGWDAGASFGARRFVSCTLPFAFGLAAAIDLARRRPMLPIGLIAAGLIATNLSLVDDARTGALTLSAPVPFERMSEALSSRAGNPFVLPGALWFSWQHRVPVAFLDHAPARKYNRLQVDVGSSQDRGHLFGSWHDPERNEAGAFRWAAPPEVGLLVRLRQERYVLRLIVQPFEWPGSPPQKVEVWLGDRPVAKIVLSSGRQQYEVELPDASGAAGHWVRVGLRFAHAAVPREVIDSTDARPLAALFYSIELEPR